MIAASLIQTPDEAEKALATGLSLVATGQSLVMNPDWIELAGEGHEAESATVLDPAHVPQLAMPDKLWNVIQAAKGWFSLATEG